MSDFDNTPFPSEGNQPETPEAPAALPLKLDVNVRPIEPIGNLLGFASVKINDAFVVENLRVCVGEKGMFVNMPSQQDRNGEWHDTFFPITAAAREQLNSAVIGAYSKKLMEMQQTVDMTKNAVSQAAEKGAERSGSSLQDKLKQNSEKAKQQPKPGGGPAGNPTL